MAEYFKKDGDDYVKVDDTLFSQAEIDNDIIPKRLERERKKFADYDELKEKAGKVDTISKEYEDKLKTVGTEKSELEKQLSGAKLETDKVKIIHEFKLSDELAEFVTGETADDMRAKAEKLSKGVSGGKIVIDKKGKPGEKQTDSKKIAKSLFGAAKSDD
jgi:hypothetical protein